MDAAALTQTLQGMLRSAQTEATVGSVATAFAIVALLPMAGVVPMTLVCLAVAARLPPVPAFLVILSGAEANTLIAWVVARTVFGARVEDWLQRRGGWLGAVRDGAVREPLKWAFLARYMPAPFIAAPMVLSAAGVGLGTTLLGTLLRMTPWAAVYVYATHAGRQDSIAGFSRAAAVLVLGYTVLRLLRRRLADPGPQSHLLVPRRVGVPLIQLYTLEGQELSADARRDISRFRDSLGFEVEEILLGAGDAGGNERFRNHAPVAVLNGERLFNYQMDENVLKERLLRLKRTSEKV